MKKIVLLGSTGSIGQQTLNVVRRNPDKFEIVALSAFDSAEMLNRQAEEFKPRYLALGDASKKNVLTYKSAEIYYGANSAEKLCSIQDADLIVVAVVGMVGLDIVLSALKHGKTVALANKESLVAGGELIQETLKQGHGKILPIDSEHSAVWQCIDSRKDKVKRIILTASGGPFRGYDIKKLQSVTVEQALKHPNWKMGSKISIDSATMMNKALEIIEARWLFDNKNIGYIIHPESIIHSLVEFEDGSMLAQLATPNMEIPIAYALSYPERLSNPHLPFEFDRPLTFEAADETVFKAPKLAYECLIKGGNAACALNAANEAAVELFLKHKISFTEITEICENILTDFEFISDPDLIDLHNTYNKIRQRIIC